MGIRGPTYIAISPEATPDLRARWLKAVSAEIRQDERGTLVLFEANLRPLWARFTAAPGLASTSDMEAEMHEWHAPSTQCFLLSVEPVRLTRRPSRLSSRSLAAPSHERGSDGCCGHRYQSRADRHVAQEGVRSVSLLTRMLPNRAAGNARPSRRTLHSPFGLQRHLSKRLVFRSLLHDEKPRHFARRAGAFLRPPPRPLVPRPISFARTRRFSA